MPSSNVRRVSKIRRQSSLVMAIIKTKQLWKDSNGLFKRRRVNVRKQRKVSNKISEGLVETKNGQYLMAKGANVPQIEFEPDWLKFWKLIKADIDVKLKNDAEQRECQSKLQEERFEKLFELLEKIDNKISASTASDDSFPSSIFATFFQTIS